MNNDHDNRVRVEKMISSYSYAQNHNHDANRMSAPVIVDLADAQQRMNDRLDEVIPKRYRNARVERPEIRAWVDAYVDDPAGAPSLFLQGPVGSGKTWAAYGALREAAVRSLRPNRAGRYVLGTWTATTFPDFLAHMRPGYFGTRDDMTAEKYMLGLRTSPLLLIDDLGVGKESGFVEEITHRLVSGRYDDELPTIYTTNLDTPGLRESIGARLTSRLAEQCAQVRFLEGDRRRSQK